MKPAQIPHTHEYPIVAIDAAGASSSIRLLQTLERNTRDLLTPSTIFAGSGPGALLALYMANKPPQTSYRTHLDDCVSFFNQIETFYRPSPVNIARGFIGCRSAFTNRKLQSFLEEVFGAETMLRDLPGSVVVMYFNLIGKMELVLANNLREESDLRSNDNDNIRVVDAALSCVATPLVRPLWRGKMDGSLNASNPSVAAITALIDARTKGNYDVFQTQSLLNQTVLLSLGVDLKKLRPKSINYFFQKKDLNWGWLPWMLYPFHPFLFLDAFLQADTQRTDYNSRSLLGPCHYFRLAYQIDSHGYIADILKQAVLPPCLQNKRIDAAINKWVSEPSNSNTRYSPTYEDTETWLSTMW
ncbi:MAG: hypothetical protein EP343_20730 [Deltaproteobacteria bacterium]|nr:MAG: hypothetical protein EP343_20730 [Deltaproteobacteria bacterium]